MQTLGNRPALNNNYANAVVKPLSEKERRNATILLVEEDVGFRQKMRQFFQSLGFNSISDVSDHKLGLSKLRERNFTYLVFSTQSSGVKIEGFLKQALRLDQSSIPIAISQTADGEEMFELLQLGAKGVLVHPITQERVDAAIAMATNGKPIPESILQAKDRNRSLAILLSSNIDKAAQLLKIQRDSGSSTSELSSVMESLRRTAKVAHTFALGGAAALLASIESVFIEKGQGPSSRLGRVRQQLRERREKNRRDS